MITCLLLDFDGVLARLARAEAENELERHAEFLLVRPAELLDRLFYANPHTQAIDSGAMSYSQMLTCEAVRFWSGSFNGWHVLWERIWGFYQPNFELLNSLDTWQARVGPSLVVTDNHIDFRNWLGRHPTLIKCAERLLCSAEIGVTKPHEKFFEAAKNLTNVAFCDSLFIDDDNRNVEFARRLGLNTCLYEADHPERAVQLINRQLQKT